MINLSGWTYHYSVTLLYLAQTPCLEDGIGSKSFGSSLMELLTTERSNASDLVSRMKSRWKISGEWIAEKSGWRSLGPFGQVGEKAKGRIWLNLEEACDTRSKCDAQNSNTTFNEELGMRKAWVRFTFKRGQRDLRYVNACAHIKFAQ